MIISMTEVIEAAKVAKARRIATSRWLRVDETKGTSPKDVMLLHRVREAIGDGSGAFDEMLRDRDVNRPFNDGALYFERMG
jgi:hypothetical protein